MSAPHQHLFIYDGRAMWTCACGEQHNELAVIQPPKSEVVGAAPERASLYQPPQTLVDRLRCMADALESAKPGPQARFFTRQRVAQIVLLLREAERDLLNR